VETNTFFLLSLHFLSEIVKGGVARNHVTFYFVYMARVEELLELLNTLILSSVNNTVTIDKTTL
jgi:hypothetical protein